MDCVWCKIYSLCDDKKLKLICKLIPSFIDLELIFEQWLDICTIRQTPVK